MTTVLTWHQDTFLTPDREIWRKDGDFYSVDDFIPSLDGARLERAPSWSSHITYPTNFKEPQAAFYDTLYNNLVFVGSSEAGSPDVVGTFTIDQDDLSASSVYSTSGTTRTDIGGRHKQNALYVFDDFWFIGNNYHVFKCNNPYGTAASDVYSSGVAWALLPVRDTVYMMTMDNDILRWNSGTSAFESYYSHWLALGSKYFLFHYRDDLLYLGYQADGSAHLFRIDETPPAELRQLAYIEPATGYLEPDTANGRWGTPWAMYEGDMYFSPGATLAASGLDFDTIPIYRYTGSDVRHVDTISAPVTPYSWGLVNWRDRLLLYLLDNADQRIYALHRGKFVQVMTGTHTLSTDSDLYSLGGQLAMFTTVDTDAGLIVTQNKADGVFTSSWLDMGHPGSQKHLSRLACVVGNPAQDFKVKIEYRTEDGSWTEATEQDDTRYVYIGDLGVTFYLLQIRITFTEDISPATYPAVTLESLSATYSYGVR